MKKVIVMSVRSEWLAKELNGEKTVEVRTRVPKDFVGEIHLACTKAWPFLHYRPTENCDTHYVCWDSKENALNGKVVAKFDYDYKKVDEYPAFWFENTGIKELDYLVFPEDKEKMCLEDDDLRDYGKGKPLFAIPLTNLAIFDKPRDLGEYCVPTYFGNETVAYHYRDNEPEEDTLHEMYLRPLTRCPQSYQFAYVGEE